MPKINAETPKLYTCGRDLSKKWFVGFRMNNPADPFIRKAFQFRGNINEGRTIAERSRRGNELAKGMKAALDAGWNPFEIAFSDWLEKSRPKKKPTDIETVDFIQALEIGLKMKRPQAILTREQKEEAKKKNKKLISRATFYCYQNHIKYAAKAARKLQLHHKTLPELTKPDSIALLEEMQLQRGWTGHAYNIAVSALAAMVAPLVKAGKINYNIFNAQERQIEAEPEERPYPTQDQKTRIKNRLYYASTNFYAYCMIIYHTGIRPKEVLAMKIKSYLKEDNMFKLDPGDPGDENTKNGKRRYAPVNRHLQNIIANLKLDNCPDDWYIFSTNFKPGPKRLHRNTASKWWKKIIMAPPSKGGLGLPFHLYDLKYWGGDDKILAGVDLNALKELYGHSSKRMTVKYLTKLKQIHFNQILEKSPAF